MKCIFRGKSFEERNAYHQFGRDRMRNTHMYSLEVYQHFTLHVYIPQHRRLMEVEMYRYARIWKKSAIHMSMYAVVKM